MKAKKIFAMLLTLMITMTVFTAMPEKAYAADENFSVDGTYYEKLGQALEAVAASQGNTIKLHTDFRSDGTLVIDGNTGDVEFDLNGYTLTINGGSNLGLYVEDGGSLSLADPSNGALNITGTSGVRVQTSAEVSNVTATFSSGYGVWAEMAGNNTEVTVHGTITSAGDYIKIAGQTRSMNSGVASQTKPGYLEYTDGYLAVWTKYPYVGTESSPIPINLGSVSANSTGYFYTSGNPNIITIIGNGYYEITGSATNKRILVLSNLTDVNIKMNGANITNTSLDYNPFDMSGAKVNLTLIGTNIISGICSSGELRMDSGSLTIGGDGTLNIDCPADYIDTGWGIRGSQACELVINSGTVNISGSGGPTSYGADAISFPDTQSSVTINGGTLSALGGGTASSGIASSYTYINGGSLTAIGGADNSNHSVYTMRAIRGLVSVGMSKYIYWKNIGNVDPGGVGTYSSDVPFSNSNHNYVKIQQDTRTPVTNTGGTMTTSYATAMNLSTIGSPLFTIDPNAGVPTFTIEPGGTGTGKIGADNKTFTVTKLGTFKLGLVTAGTTTHLPGSKVIGTLTVDKTPLYISGSLSAQNVTYNKITVNAISPPVGTTLEYGINTSMSSPTKWQVGTTFTNLTPNTDYYVFARVKETDFYRPDNQLRSAVIRTLVAPISKLTVNSGTGSGNYAADTKISINANTPPAGKVFAKWTGGNGGTFANVNSPTTTFTMPGNAATITATYEAPVEAFVERLYTVVLGRASEAAGKKFHVDNLVAKRTDGASTAMSFFLSSELTNRNLSDSAFLEVCYKTFFNRASDATGKAYWQDWLNNGVSRKYVLQGFINSAEYTKVCKDYGINRGTYTSDEARDKNPLVAAFVSRLYSECLGRKGEANGLNFYSNNLLTGVATGKETARGFVYSVEFDTKYKTQQQKVTAMYKALLGRNPDQSGLNFWMSQTKDQIFNGMSGSIEFTYICNSYGIRAR